MRTKLGQVLLGAFPGYAIMKSLADNMQQSDDIANSFVPVLLKSDDTWQMAIEIDRTTSGIVAIYLPGAPNPCRAAWSSFAPTAYMSCTSASRRRSSSIARWAEARN